RPFPRGAGLVAALAVLVAAASVASPHFLNPVNLLNVLRQVAMYGILGIGMTFVILTRGIDLSVGSTVALTGVSGALLLAGGLPIPLMVSVCLLLGVGIGAANGLAVSLWRIP